MPSESKSRSSNNNSRSNHHKHHGKKSSSGSRPRRSSHHSSGEDEDEDYNEEEDFGTRTTTTRRTTRTSRNKTSIPPDRIAYSSTMITAETVLEVLPIDYVKHQHSQVEPVLYHLPKLAAGTTATATASGTSGTSGTSSGTTTNSTTTTTFPNLRVLMAAAQEDIRLHRARQQAAKERDLSHLPKYQLEQDPQWLARQQRLNERALLWQELLTQGPKIWKDLLQDHPTAKITQGLTAHEATQVQLARWQRALEYYVYSPKSSSTTGGTPTTTTATDVTPKPAPTTTEALGMLELLEHLSEGVAEEDKLSQVLEQALGMCDTLVHVTQQMVQDATHELTMMEDAYQIRLEAHEVFSRYALQRQEEIQNQFRINGRAALQIGNQLEFAERKRQRCQSASTLIRRWWLLESLAEQEALTGDTLKVEEEIRGMVPIHSCRMDPLFTKPEHSLEASRTLQQLRQVLRSRGNPGSNNNDTTTTTTTTNEASSSSSSTTRRFDLTASLIRRTSSALETRLLEDFSKLYSQGGTYDFSTTTSTSSTTTTSKKGVLPWQTLRDLAHASLLFDTGRTLHQRYVDLVVTTRFPELLDPKRPLTQRSTTATNNNNNTSKSHLETSQASLSASAADLAEQQQSVPSSPAVTAEEDESLDTTRTQLSSLFHRVSQVCMQEFQLIAYVFDTPTEEKTESIPLHVARMLCTRVIGDPQHGLQAKIHGLLDGIDQRGADFDAGAKKLDTFVVIHEKAAGLFQLLKDAAERLLRDSASDRKDSPAARNAVESLKSFLLSQEVSLNSVHRVSYLNLELRLLHHKCCGALDQAGCALVRPAPVQLDASLLEKGILQDYTAPLVPLDKEALKRSGFTDILSGPLKQSVLRQPLIDATDSLARASLMFGKGREGGEGAAKVMAQIYSQMCHFYGSAFLYPILDALAEMLKATPPNAPPSLPFDEEQTAHDLGVDPAMWVALERIHSAAKSFDRELWAQGKKDSHRVWELLTTSGDSTGVNNAMAMAQECRVTFFTALEQKGEDAIFRALDTLSAHIQWILVTGSEAMLGGAKSLFGMAGSSTGGPYSMSSGSSLEAPNSAAVKSLCYCLRVQFVHVQAALTPSSLSAFWTALSMRIYDVLVARLLQNWVVSTVGAVILARDVEALRSVSMLAGSQHSHWDLLRELLTLYMTPPDALKIMLVGSDGDGKGLFARAGKDQSLVFMSRRVDYRYKTNQGQRKSGWATRLLEDLKVRDPTDFTVNIGKFAAARLFAGGKH